MDRLHFGDDEFFLPLEDGLEPTLATNTRSGALDFVPDDVDLHRLTAQVSQHEVRLNALELHQLVHSDSGDVRRTSATNSNSHSTAQVLLTRNSRIAPSSAPVASASNGNTNGQVTAHVCPRGCRNETGVAAGSAPSAIKKHLWLVAHVEFALALATPLLHCQPSRCTCAAPDLLPVNVERVLRTRTPDVADLFANIPVPSLCKNRHCLALATTDDSPVLRAIAAAQELKRSGRKRSARDEDGTEDCDDTDDTDDEPPPMTAVDSTMIGDQTVALAFGASKFSTPGAVYVVFDAASNQVRVQMERPAAPPFHVAHVARMHRWMKHVIHFSPQHHKLWNTHVAVADAGYLDAFVLVSAAAVVGNLAEHDEREKLFARIVSGDLVLCAGRSNGWLDLVPASAVAPGHHIVLPLSHLQPHSFRVYDPDAQPSVPILSDNRSVAPSGFDIRMQHYQPRPVSAGGGVVKIEMLCKCSGWHLVAPNTTTRTHVDSVTNRVAYEAVDGERVRGRRMLQSLVETMAAEARSKLASDGVEARKRTLLAIEQAEELRLQLIKANKRQAQFEHEAREQNARGNAALVARISQLEAQLREARETAQVTVTIPTGEAPAPPAAQRHMREALLKVAPGTSLREALMITNVLEPTTATVEDEMLRSGRTIALYCRRNNQGDLRLCTRVRGERFVHSKITQHENGTYSCVREVHASSLEALFNELDL